MRLAYLHGLGTYAGYPHKPFQERNIVFKMQTKDAVRPTIFRSKTHVGARGQQSSAMVQQGWESRRDVSKNVLRHVPFSQPKNFLCPLRLRCT